MKNYLIRAIFLLFCTIITFSGCSERNKEKSSVFKENIQNLFKKKTRLNRNISSSLKWNYEYNDEGLITKITDPGGKSTELTYQFYPDNKSLIQAIEKKTADGQVIYRFDLAGNLIEMQDKFGKVYYEYDQLQRLIKVARTNNPTISYTYNSSDQVTSLSLSNGYRINYVYDFLDRLSKMVTPAGEINYNYYTGDGIIARELPNGIKTQYKYQPDGKLESIIHFDKNNNILISYKYTYNPEGLISKISEWTTNGKYILTYGYDNVQRLIAFTDKDGIKTEYKYDEFGNRLETEVNGQVTETYTYDGLGRILTANGHICEYDNSGNLISTKGGEKEYYYNDINQISQAGNTSYEYDGNGFLITRKNNTRKTEFLNNPLSDSWQPLLEISEIKDNTYYIWEGNSPIAVINNDNISFYLADHLNSVRAITDLNCKVIQRINYSPFGIADQDYLPKNFMPGFTGLFFEPVTNLYLTKTRTYDPYNGRFLQIDPLHQIPLGIKRDFSIFAYCGNDPINSKDNKGTQSTPINNNAWQELYRIQSAMNKFVRLQWELNYPNETNPGYYKCFQWQNRVYEELENLNPKEWEYFRYAEVDPNNEEKLTHFFVVIRNKSDASIMYKIDPWRPDITTYYKDWLPNKDLQSGHAGDLKPFKPEKRYINYPNKIPDNDVVRTWLDKFIDLINIFKVEEAWGDEITPLNGIFKTPSSPAIHGGRGMHHPWGSYWNPPKEFGSFKSTSLSPSNVGGVYLGGAGKAFKGLGQLSGIAIDESTGRLVLISEEKGKIELPPLRLDDVVTVFRSVYRHGEAPFVSIDPDSINPWGPIMHTRHGAATKNTYVGWILFEADRVMKAYSLGEDNITKKQVKSKIAGYGQVLDAMFSGKTGDQTWERFWIVPSSVERKISSDNSLTLFDVSLMVKTEKMIMKNGKLVTDPGGKSSFGAEMFSKWFTENYDTISDESFSLPPEGSSISEPVPVFSELRRIAFITAIAEQLRDQGIPLPFWMRGYEVKSFPSPETTPSHTVSRNNGNSILTIFGGVNLTPETSKIINKPGVPEATKVAREVTVSIKNQPYSTPVPITVENKKYEAVVFPGNDSKDLGPCVLNENDLSLQISGDYYLTLTRKYNSFISPLDDMFGKNWTLDLPVLEEQKIPVKNTVDGTQYRFAYNLFTPLNTFSERIENMYIGDNKLIGFKTRIVSPADGTNLHFNEKGQLVAYEEKPLLILYNRDSENRIFQIVGFYGQKAHADIKLEYDKEKVVAATGSNGESVRYVYSPAGDLHHIIHSKKASTGKSFHSKDLISYEYKNSLLTAIRYNEKLARQFRYNEKGQLIGELSPESLETEHNISHDSNGYQLTTYLNPENKKEKKPFIGRFKTDGKKSVPIEPQKEVIEFIQYDISFRPVKQITENGQTIIWNYSDSDYDKMRISHPSGYEFSVRQSKDGRELSYSLPDGIDYEEHYNDQGQLVSFTRNNIPLYQQKWFNSKLLSTQFENSSLHYDYDENMIFKRTLITPPGENNTWNEWVEYKYDETGNLSETNDQSGMKAQYKYDENGELSSVSSNQGNIDVKRTNGLVNEVETSWGEKIKYNYNPNGLLKEIYTSTTDGFTSVKFKNGQISDVSRSDGSKYLINYFQGNKNSLIKQIKTPVNTLKYSYNKNDQLINVLCNNRYQVEYNYNDLNRIKEIQISAR